MPDSSPPPKRQRTATGYKSASNSAHNTNTYNSDNDSGDDLFTDFIPDTPSNNTYQTQPTQILDRSAEPASSRPGTPQNIVQVPASSPFTERDLEGLKPAQSSKSAYFQSGPPMPRMNLGSAMAPAGTAYKPPAGIVSKSPPKPTRAYVTLDDDEDEGPKFQGGASSDDEEFRQSDIKPSTFVSKSAQSSFGAAPPPAGEVSKRLKPNLQAILDKAKYDPKASSYPSAKRPQTQSRPERAAPVTDLLDEQISRALRENVQRLKIMFPSCSNLFAQNALLVHNNNLNDAAYAISTGGFPDQLAAPNPIVIDDDEIEEISRPENLFKRTLTAPTQSLRDKYSSTQALQARSPATVVTPPKPKRKLMKGRRNPSSPAIPAMSSPLKQQSPAPADYEDYDSDSGVASESEEDPEISERVLKYFNTCKVADLVELTNITKDVAEVMIAARPFKTLDAARTVENKKPLKSGKKSNRAPVGDKIVDTALEMFQGYEAIDKLVAKCSDLGKPLAEEMSKWGFDVFGASKAGELEMTSLEDDADSQRDSGIGSPSSAAASNNGDEDIKVVSGTRKRGNVQFLKKPDKMAADCVLKDYQVVGLNWLALMYKHKLSCILADEMGLGKTCQVIAFLTHLVETGHPGPHLVVCPGSTLENWLREFQRFSPNLAVEPYHGPQKERSEMADQILDNRAQINVVVTTYDMAAKKEDNKFMRKLNPDVGYFSCRKSRQANGSRSASTMKVIC